MFKGKCDFSSRFRILKGGKVSLVMSALALGSLVNFANAVSTTISTAETSIQSYTSVFTDPSNSFFLGTPASITITDDNIDYAIYIDQDTNQVSVKTNGTVSLLNMNNTAEPGAAAIYTRGTGRFDITNNNNMNVSSSGYGAYGIVNSGANGYIINK